MAAEGARKYSAGTIFLQVSPVFRRFQEDVADYTRDIDRTLGDQMEDAGARAGTRAGKAAAKNAREELAKSDLGKELERQIRDGADGIDKALGSINTRNLGKKLRGEVAAMRKDLEDISDIDLTLDANVEKAAAKVKALRSQIEDMRKRSKVFFDIEGLPEVYRAIHKIERAVEQIDATIDVDVNTRGAERDLTAFERTVRKAMTRSAASIKGSLNPEVRRLRDELEYLSKLRVGPNLEINSAEMRNDIREITAELQSLRDNDPDLDVRLEANEAWAELAELTAALDRLDRDDVDVDVDVDTARARRALAGLQGDLARTRHGGDDASNTFRSFNGIMLAAAGAGPALIPVLAAITGGLLAMGPAAAVAAFGLGSVLIGFSGIGDAMGALQARDEEAAKTATTGARQQIDSARAVADARRSAADAIEDALDRQADAQKRYRDSISDVKEAEQALREAREAAKGVGDDIGDRIKDNQLARDQGLLDVFHATVAYDSSLADGSATNAEQEQARINLEQARRRLEELREEQAELGKEKEKWDKKGVNGTEQVETAQDRLNDALDAQREAYESLRDAAENVDKARVDGARRVADAMRNQTRAMEDVSAAQHKVDTAFDKLGAAGQTFALFMHSLRDEFYRFRDDIQTVMLPSIQRAIEGFMGSKSGATLRRFMIDMGAGFGAFVEALSQSFQGPVWLKFFETLERVGPTIMKAYGGAFISFLEAMASIMTTLAPFALKFAEGLAAMAQRFADWADSKAGQDAIERFLGYVQKVAPDVLKFFGAFAAALVNLAVALAPYAEVVLKTLTAALDFIAGMDPAILGPVASAILALITASQIAYSFMMLLLAGSALVSTTVAVVVFALAAIAIGLAYLWNTNEGFRDFMTEAWNEIRDVIVDAWKKYLKPALADLKDAVDELWKKALQPFIAWLAPIIVKIAKFYFPMLLFYWSMVARGIAMLIRKVLIPVMRFIGWVFQRVMKDVKETWRRYGRPTWDAIAAAANWLWRKALKPFFRQVGDGWDDLMRGMRWVWNNVLKPTFNFIRDKALPALSGAFDTTVKAIKRVWEGLKRVIGAPIKFVLQTLINDGLIAGFNKVAGWVKMDGFKDIPIPKAVQQYASGGIMPGYTPGRDVHSFVSPTAGRLDLSGGEAVMRPEWTAAMGPDYVYRMNALAARGGVRAVREAAMGLGGYWMGGVLPLPGGSVSSHGNSYGHPAFDLNYPGYADYGAAVKAWRDGTVAQMNYIGDASYGRWAVLNHPGSQSSLYAHLSNFARIAVGQAVKAGQTIGYVGDLGNTGTPPTSHLHFEIKGGNVDFSDSSTGGGPKKKARSAPSFIKTLLKNPMDTIKGWASSKWADASKEVKESPAFGLLKNVPLQLASGMKDKVMSIIPGWAKAAAGVAGKAFDKAGDMASGVGDVVSGVGDAIGLKSGGILPYNGTMMYDNGGYLPPGLTSVVNLTGKPEPVFTNDQFRDGLGAPGGNITYAPTFQASDLTAADVAGDLNFTLRRLARRGKYGGVGQ